jgi:hypothetical protein
MVPGTGAWGFASLLKSTDAQLKTLGTEPKTETFTCLIGEIGHGPPGTGILGFASLLHSTGT